MPLLRLASALELTRERTPSSQRAVFQTSIRKLSVADAELLTDVMSRVAEQEDRASEGKLDQFAKGMRTVELGSRGGANSAAGRTNPSSCREVASNPNYALSGQRPRTGVHRPV